jgi:hypothetical protein
LESKKELSGKAKQNLQRNAELHSKSDFFNPQPGEKHIRIFDAEKMEPVEREFEEGKPVIRYQYMVVDPNTGEEQKWTVSKTVSKQIDAYLLEGHTTLKIQRNGTGTKTTYTIMNV